MVKRILLLLILANTLILHGYGQHKFESFVVDENNIAIAGAIVVRLDQKNTILESSLTDTSGFFSLQSVDFHAESVKISAFGYKTEEIKEMPVNNKEKIVLRDLSVHLNEVVVTGKSNVIQKNDRLIFNAFNPSLTKGNNTYELLKITPLIQENNRKISIIGKESVLLYINGRKSNLTQEAQQSYLQSLPADNIESIEVITNPGVTYSVSGNQGIINLIVKRNEAEGLKGSLNLGDSQTQKKNSQNGSLYLDFQKHKFALTSSLFINNQNMFSENTTDYYFFNDNKRDKGRNEIDSRDLYAGGNFRIDYYLSKNHTLGTVVDFLHVNRKINTNNQTSYYGSLNGLTTDSIYQSHSTSREPTSRLSFNVNYRAKLSETGNTLSLDIDYLKNNRSQNILNNFNRLPIEGLLDYRYEFDQKSEDDFKNYSAKAEYKHIVTSKHNLTVGVEFYNTATSSAFSYTHYNESQPIPDPTKNNRFDYDESFLSGYVSYNWTINDKIMGSAGLKAENVDSKGWQKTTDERVKRHDFDLLPNFSILYQPNANNRLSYNFYSFAARPGYYSLNPFRFFINPNTYKEYNPNLKTVNAYNQSLSYTFNRNYIIGLGYNYLKNVTNNFLIPVDDQYIKLINVNYGTLHTINPHFTWISSFFDNRLTSRFTATGNYRRDKGKVETVIINNKGYSYDFSLYSDFLLSKETNWSLNFNGTYRSKVKLAHEDIDASYNVSLGVRKVFPHNISLNFGVRSLFMNVHDVRQKMTSDYQYYIKNKFYFQTGYITLSVPFGNQKTKGAQNRRTPSFESSYRLKE